jgi:hypothetical protein
MDRKTGIVTAVLFLAGLLYRAGSPDVRFESESGARAARTNLPEAVSTPTSGTSSAEGPWTPVCSYFGANDGASSDESSKDEGSNDRHTYRPAESQFCVDRRPVQSSTEL